MATYAEKLRDPRWQRRRLEILEARGWACEHCGRTDETLHVHHGHYESGLDPWDYDDAYLHVLCETHHEAAHGLLLSLQRTIGAMSLEELAVFSVRFGYALDAGVPTT